MGWWTSDALRKPLLSPNSVPSHPSFPLMATCWVLIQGINAQSLGTPPTLNGKKKLYIFSNSLFQINIFFQLTTRKTKTTTVSAVYESINRNQKYFHVTLLMSPHLKSTTFTHHYFNIKVRPAAFLLFNVLIKKHILLYHKFVS